MKYKYLLRAITALILAELTVRWLQVNLDDYWPMFPYWVWHPIAFLNWLVSWSPIVYGFFLLAALHPNFTKSKRTEESEILDEDLM